jgi:acetyl esterase/lipase
MQARILLAIAATMFWSHSIRAQVVTPDVAYMDDGHQRHKLDIYTPTAQTANQKQNLPVVFWIHGGGWQAGDKSDVGLKPKVLTERGFVVVSTGYRLLPEVDMETLLADVAASVGWVHKNISKHGGNPNHIFIGGHSAGAQIAALLCVDERYLKKEGVSLSSLAGCIPVDGDTYDIPKIIMTAEHRQTLYGGKMFTFGHRQKFGNDPVKHVDFSAVTHIAPDKHIPPFLILYFSGNPDTTVQAQRLEAVLKQSQIEVTVLGKSDTNHSRLNNELGTPDDPATVALYKFLDAHQ